MTTPTRNGAASSSNSPTDGTNVTSLSWSHTVAAGTNQILVVGVEYFRSPGTTVAVTWNGAALTSHGRAGPGNNEDFVELFYLINPTPATGNVVVTPVLSLTLRAGAQTWSNAAQSSPFRTLVSATGNSQTPSVNATSVADDVVIDVVGYFTTPAFTITAGFDSIWEKDQPTTLVNGGAQQSRLATTSSTTMSWTLSGTAGWWMAAAALRGEAAADTANIPGRRIYVLP